MMDEDEKEDPTNGLTTSYRKAESKTHFLTVELEDFLERSNMTEWNKKFSSGNYEFTVDLGQGPLNCKAYFNIYPGGKKDSREVWHRIHGQDLRDHIAIELMLEAGDYDKKVKAKIELKGGISRPLMLEGPTTHREKNLYRNLRAITYEEVEHEKHEFIVGGSLTFKAEFSVSREWQSVLRETDKEEPINLIGLGFSAGNRMFNKLLSLGKFQDITLAVPLPEDPEMYKEFRCHRYVLAVKSDVFNRMFEYDKDVIKIEDTDPQAMAVFLHFLYNGLIENVELFEENAIGLYWLADKYNIQELKLYCEQYFMENLGTEKTEFPEMARLAHFLGTDKFKKTVATYLKENAETLRKNREWKEFFGNNFETVMGLICEMDKLKLTYE